MDVVVAPSGSGIARAWNAIVEPAASVWEPELRRRARLLSALVLSLAFTGLIGSIVMPTLLNPWYGVFSTPTSWLGCAASLALLVPHVLTRSGRIAAGAFAATVIANVGVWGVVGAEAYATGGALPVFFLIIPLLLAGFFLRPRSIAAVLAVNLVALVASRMFLPITDVDGFAASVIYVMMVGALVIALASVSERDLRQIEEARRQVVVQEKLSALGRLVAGVAHEVNNPLAYVRAHLELATMSLEEAREHPDVPAPVRAVMDEVLEFHEPVLEGVDRIAGIASSLRDVARNGRVAVVPADMNAVMEKGLAMATPRFGNGVEVQKDLRAETRALLSTHEMTQVVLNLVLNAGDAVAPLGGGTITLATRDDAAAGVVVAEVRDTGVGIPAAARAQVFDPFFSTKSHGTGLGLSISHRIVREHGGELTVESGNGSGTTFRLTVPMAPTDGPRAPSDASAERLATQPTAPPPRIGGW